MSAGTGAWHAGVVAAARRAERRLGARALALIATALLGVGLWALGQAGVLHEAAGGGPVVTVAPDDAENGAAGQGAEEPVSASEEPVTEPAVAQGEEPEPSQEPAEEEPEPALDLAAVQRQLADLGFYLGAADGVQGQQTTAAVMAFQKVNEIQVDGVVGPQTLGALEDPRTPQVGEGAATRVDVDLTKQLLHLVEDGQRVVTLHISSGNGQPYETSSGGTAYGNTPVGSFVVERRISGVREADLGTLYDPLYFLRGWAIHGSNSVPAHPASHGCIRVTRADGKWLFDRVPDGTPVVVHGGQHVFTPSGG
jgi:lipoprotein-anchoring transpeptidase ErfK/SrfK